MAMGYVLLLLTGLGHRVRRVVGAVREIEDECSHHDHHDDDGHVHGPRLPDAGMGIELCGGA
jgi:hypothetical protein